MTNKAAAQRGAERVLETRAVPIPPPRDYWKCFHCGEVFVDEESAAKHFGPRDPNNPLHAREIKSGDARQAAPASPPLEEDTAKLARRIHIAVNVALHRQGFGPAPGCDGAACVVCSPIMAAVRAAPGTTAGSCRHCDCPQARCEEHKASGYLACCPECDHRPLVAEDGRSAPGEGR